MELRKAIVGLGMVIGVIAGVYTARSDEPVASAEREVSAELAPFEYLVGSWKGAGIPTANRVRGWNETHAWAWKFEKGKVVGMSVEFEANKVIAKALLKFDPTTKHYSLAGSDPDGKPLAFSGTLDASGKTLTLDRVGLTTDGAKQRFTLFPNSNHLRYSVFVTEQEKGAPQYKRMLEMSMTKEGESFAASSAASSAPKCIVTGGTATMSITYEGKTYPLCCTGCRDEFNENPQKYLKKLSLKVAADGAAPVKPTGVTSSKVTRDDDTFGSVLDDGDAKPRPGQSKAAGKMNAKGTPTEKAEKADSDKPAKTEKTETDKPDPAVAAARAATYLRLGQNLEKAGKTTAALGYYRQIVKDYAETPSAKTAAARIKALAKPD